MWFPTDGDPSTNATEFFHSTHCTTDFPPSFFVSPHIFLEATVVSRDMQPSFFNHESVWVLHIGRVQVSCGRPGALVQSGKFWEGVSTPEGQVNVLDGPDRHLLRTLIPSTVPVSTRCLSCE